MHCLKTKFTPINRRVSVIFTRIDLIHTITPALTPSQHHCRKCGAVVCGGCSNRRFLLPYQDKKPLRVCVSCYEALTAGEADRDIASG